MGFRLLATLYLERGWSWRKIRVKFGDSATLVTHIRGTFDLAVFTVTLGLFGALVSKCNSKMAGRKAKLTEIWDSGTVVTYMGYLWPCSVQGNVGVICFKRACNSKVAGRGAK